MILTFEVTCKHVSLIGVLELNRVLHSFMHLHVHLLI